MSLNNKPKSELSLKKERFDKHMDNTDLILAILLNEGKITKETVDLMKQQLRLLNQNTAGLADLLEYIRTQGDKTSMHSMGFGRATTQEQEAYSLTSGSFQIILTKF